VARRASRCTGADKKPLFDAVQPVGVVVPAAGVGRRPPSGRSSYTTNAADPSPNWPARTDSYQRHSSPRPSICLGSQEPGRITWLYHLVVPPDQVDHHPQLQPNRTCPSLSRMFSGPSTTSPYTSVNKPCLFLEPPLAPKRSKPMERAPESPALLTTTDDRPRRFRHGGLSPILFSARPSTSPHRPPFQQPRASAYLFRARTAHSLCGTAPDPMTTRVRPPRRRCDGVIPPVLISLRPQDENRSLNAPSSPSAALQTPTTRSAPAAHLLRFGKPAPPRPRQRGGPHLEDDLGPPVLPSSASHATPTPTRAIVVERQPPPARSVASLFDCRAHGASRTDGGRRTRCGSSTSNRSDRMVFASPVRGKSRSRWRVA